MNPEIKAQWTAALRSGAYRQGEGALRNDNNEFCCLGVLCDLAVKANVIPEPSLDGVLYVYGPEGDHFWSCLPCAVEEWAGIDGIDPVDLLVDMNDSGESFEIIADVIEADL